MFIALSSKNRLLANDSSSEEDGEVHCTFLERTASTQMPRRSRRGMVKVPGKAVKVECTSLPAGLESGDEGMPALRSTSVPCALTFADNLRAKPRAPASLGEQERSSSSSSPSPVSDTSPMTLVDAEEAVGSGLFEKDFAEVEATTPTPSPVSLRSFHSVPEEDSGHESPSERETAASSPQQLQAAPASQSWLMRLFQSKLFDMSIAIHYLFNSKEPGVQSYLGSKLFVSVCHHACMCVHVRVGAQLQTHMDELAPCTVCGTRHN